MPPRLDVAGACCGGSTKRTYRITAVTRTEAPADVCREPTVRPRRSWTVCSERLLHAFTLIGAPGGMVSGVSEDIEVAMTST